MGERQLQTVMQQNRKSRKPRDKNKVYKRRGYDSTKMTPNLESLPRKGNKNEINKLLDQKHFIKLDQTQAVSFISPIVITLKKEQTEKLALDSNKIKKFAHKKNYQLTNIESLLDNIGQTIKPDVKDTRLT